MIYFLVNPPDPEPLLRIPVSDVQKYSSKPLKWICYVTGAVLGAQGILSSLDEDDQDIDIEDSNSTCRKLLSISNEHIRIIDRDGLNHFKSMIRMLRFVLHPPENEHSLSSKDCPRFSAGLYLRCRHRK